MTRPVLILLVLVATTVYAAEQKYTTKYDNVDLDDILRNERLLKKAFMCLMDEGGCTPDVLELKKALPDALKSECAKCSEKQREGAHKTLKYIFQNKKDFFDRLERKYDPEGIYRTKNQALFDKEIKQA